jgi:hypothetical protein
MTTAQEIQSTLGLLSLARKDVRGHTFSEEPELYKHIESLKAIIAILRNPNHYVEKYAELDAKRALRYRGSK